MGGYQAINFGLDYLDKFAYIGGFSPAPTTNAETCVNNFLQRTGKDVSEVKDMVRYMFLSN